MICKSDRIAFMLTQKKLSQRTLLQIVVGTGIVILAITMIKYVFIKEIIENRVMASRNEIMAEHKDRESLIFKSVEFN